jgi:putative hydrolase of the HAD superfamily
MTHLLFDFFGTLVDYSDSQTEQGYERSHAILLDHGATLGYEEFLALGTEVFAEFETRAAATHDEYSMDEVVTALLCRQFTPDRAAEILRAFRDTYLAEWNKGVRYIEGVTPMLRELASRYSLVLVTNTHYPGLVHGHLRNMGADGSFAAIVTSIEHGKRKPHPGIFEHALAVSGGRAEAALHVGDSYTADYAGARAAGLRCLLVDPAQRHEVGSDRLAHILELTKALPAPGG